MKKVYKYINIYIKSLKICIKYYLLGTLLNRYLIIHILFIIIITIIIIIIIIIVILKVVLENGGVQRLVTLVHSTNSSLRLNAIWALKNIVFSAESQIKDKIMKELGWDQLYT